MRAVQVSRLDGPAALELVEVEEPAPGPGQLVIDVHCAGVTFPDVLLSRGEYQLRPELPFVPGCELAGVVRAAPDQSGFAPGDRVAAFCVLGAFSEVVAVDPALAFPLPDAVPMDVAAGLPMNYLTVHFGLLRRGRLRAGETVLVHGAAGGVGTAAIQVARAFGAEVIAAVSTEEKADVARRAGAHEVVAVDGFRDAVKELTAGRGVDVVLDPVGGDRFTDSLRCLGPEGRLLVVGFTAGDIPTVRVNRLLLGNVDVVGVGWGAFWVDRPGYLREQWHQLLPHVESGALATVLGSSYALEDAAAAVTEIADRRATGKTIIRVR